MTSKILMKKKSHDFLNFIKEKENKYGKISFMENNFRGKRKTNDRFFKSFDLVLYGMYSILNFSWAKKITIINLKNVVYISISKIKAFEYQGYIYKIKFFIMYVRRCL